MNFNFLSTVEHKVLKKCFSCADIFLIKNQKIKLQIIREPFPSLWPNSIGKSYLFQHFYRESRRMWVETGRDRERTPPTTRSLQIYLFLCKRTKNPEFKKKKWKIRKPRILKKWKLKKSRLTYSARCGSANWIPKNLTRKCYRNRARSVSNYSKSLL